MLAADLTLGPPAEAAEVAAFRDIAIDALLFRRAPEDWPESEGLANVTVARLGDEVVGGLVVQPMGLWVGARSVPMGAVRAVAVAPEHRGRRVAFALVRRALEADRDAGRPVSMLFAATFSVYRKAGYEHAGTFNVYRVPAHAFGNTVAPAGTVAPARRGGPDDLPAVRALYEAVARQRPGHLDRSEWFWGRRFAALTDGKAKLYLLGAGDPEGFVVLQPGVPGDTGRGTLVVSDWGVTTPAAARGLRRLLAGHRSRIDDVELRGAVGEPLLLPLADPASRIHDQVLWMLRLTDVAAALEARGWPAGRTGSLHLDVADDVLPWNRRRLVLEVEGGRATVREGGEGTLKADVRGLASLYTGHLGAEPLATCGLLDGPPETLAAATALFAGPAPWTPDMF